MKGISEFAIFCTFIAVVLGCTVNPNKNLLITDQPVLLNKTTNGEKLVIGDRNDPQRNYVHIAKLKGTAYEMGKAFGELFSQ